MIEHKNIRYETITAHNAGQRLDNYLLSQLKSVPKSIIYKIIRTGQVRVNKKRAKPAYKLNVDDMVRIPPVSLRPRANIIASLSEGRKACLTEAILFEDDDYLIVNKMRNFAVHAGSDVPVGLIEQYTTLRQDLDFLQLCHRLDRETTGCLVMAKNRTALLAFQALLKTRNVFKRYTAIVHGEWPEDLLEINQALEKMDRSQKQQRMRVSDAGKTAITKIVKIISRNRASYLEIELVTGRTHQIRAHCATMGHPVLGDRKYGNRSQDQALGLTKLPPLCLHSAEIAFRLSNPVREYRFLAPMDPDMSDIGRIFSFNPEEF